MPEFKYYVCMVNKTPLAGFAMKQDALLFLMEALNVYTTLFLLDAGGNIV